MISRFTFPLIKRAWPTLMSSQIVGVQPMTTLSSLAFYLQYVYGDPDAFSFCASVLFKDMDVEKLRAKRDSARFARPWGCKPKYVTVAVHVVLIRDNKIVFTESGVVGAILPDMSTPGVVPHLMVSVTFARGQYPDLPLRNFIKFSDSEVWREVFRVNSDLVPSNNDYIEFEIKFLDMCLAHWGTKMSEAGDGTSR